MRTRLAKPLLAAALIVASGFTVINVWPGQVYCTYLASREWIAILRSPHSYRAVSQLPPTLLPLSDPRLPDRTHFAVLPTSEIAALRKVCSRKVPQVESSWQPSRVDIELLERSLRRIELLHFHDSLLGMQVAEPVMAYRQYLPIIVHGRRLIFINGFFLTTPIYDEWRSQLFDACFGGASLWGVLYNPTTLQFSDLSVSGSHSGPGIARQSDFYL